MLRNTLLTVPCVTVKTTRFNEAAALMLRNTGTEQMEYLEALRFNEAAALMLRNTGPVRPVSNPPARFNEAAALMLRNTLR